MKKGLLATIALLGWVSAFVLAWLLLFGVLPYGDEVVMTTLLVFALVGLYATGACLSLEGK